MKVRNPLKRQRPAAWQLPGQAHSARDLILVPLLVVLGMLLYPVGASAGGGLSRVLVTDPTNTSQQAHVDASGNLQVGGTVNVGNSPTVNAQQSGGWDVGITGTPTVDNVSDPERQAVQVQGQVIFGTNAVYGVSTLYTVPANKRLVITDVSVGVSLPQGQHPIGVSLNTVVTNQGLDLAPVFLGTEPNTQGPSFDQFAVNSQTTFVVNAGDTLTTVLARDTTGEGGQGFVMVSGYLIDCTTSLPCN